MDRHGQASCICMVWHTRVEAGVSSPMRPGMFFFFMSTGLDLLSYGICFLDGNRRIEGAGAAEMIGMLISIVRLLERDGKCQDSLSE